MMTMAFFIFGDCLQYPYQLDSFYPAAIGTRWDLSLQRSRSAQSYPCLSQKCGSDIGSKDNRKPHGSNREPSDCGNLGIRRFTLVLHMGLQLPADRSQYRVPD